MTDEKKIKIMLVDDDHFLLDMYSLKFRAGGMDVVTADSSSQALEKLRKGEAVAELKWAANHATVARNGSKDVSPAALKAIFQADGTKLPAYAGLSEGDGRFNLFRIVQIKLPAAPAEAELKALRAQYDRAVAGEEVAAWLADVRTHFPVEINNKLLDSKE